MSEIKRKTKMLNDVYSQNIVRYVCYNKGPIKNLFGTKFQRQGLVVLNIYATFISSIQVSILSPVAFVIS